MLIRVNSGQLKSAFEDIATLNEQTIMFTVDNNELIITTGNSIQYQSSIEIISGEDMMNTCICVLSSNLSKLIKRSEDTTITFLSSYIKINNGLFSMTLPVSNEIFTLLRNVTHIHPKKIEHAGWLYDALLLSKKTSVFAKTLSEDRALQLRGNVAVMQYSTAWFRVISSDIECVLTSEQTNVIQKFQPTSYCVDDKLYLIRDNSYVAIPINPVPYVDEFLELSKDLKSVGYITLDSIASKFKDLLAITGPCSCDVYLCEKDIDYSIKKAMFEISKISGTSYFCSFSCQLEHLVAILNMLGDSKCEVLRSDSIVCIRNISKSIILSV